jgi:hypothetical protein
LSYGINLKSENHFRQLSVGLQQSSKKQPYSIQTRLRIARTDKDDGLWSLLCSSLSQKEGILNVGFIPSRGDIVILHKIDVSPFEITYLVYRELLKNNFLISK